MKLRNWIKEKFGATDESLLDESVYSDVDIRKDIAKLEHQLKKLEKEMDSHGQQYKSLLQEGATASDLERKKYAQKAKFEKKKYAIKKKKYRTASVKLGTILSIQGMRDIMAMQDSDGNDLSIDEAMQSADAQEIQSEVLERMAAFGIEIEDLQEIQGALDIPIMDDKVEMDTSEEEKIMADIATDEMSEEQVDVEMSVEVGSGSASVGETEFENLETDEIDV